MSLLRPGVLSGLAPAASRALCARAAAAVPVSGVWPAFLPSGQPPRAHQTPPRRAGGLAGTGCRPRPRPRRRGGGGGGPLGACRRQTGGFGMVTSRVDAAGVVCGELVVLVPVS